MEDRKTYITEISTDIIDNYFPQVDRLSDLITPDPYKATRIIINKIRRILDQFENYCPLTATSRVHVDSNGTKTFIDNYLDVEEGRVPKSELELIPMTIARVGGNTFAYSGSMSSTANYWEYAAPTLHSYSKNSYVTVSAIYHYPIYITHTEDGLLNSESHIYGLDRKQRTMLFNIMELEFLKYIKGSIERIKMPFTVEFFQLDNDIQMLTQQVEDDKTSCAAAIIAWR